MIYKMEAVRLVEETALKPVAPKKVKGSIPLASANPLPTTK
jgi:hypothetical protein